MNVSNYERRLTFSCIFQKFRDNVIRKSRLRMKDFFTCKLYFVCEDILAVETITLKF